MSSSRKNLRSPAYLRFRRRLITGLLLMATLAIALVVTQLSISYVERETAQRSQAEHYVKALEAHVLYSIQAADLSLIGFANTIKVLPATQIRSRETMSRLFSSSGSSFSNDYWITFIDASGKGIANSNGSDVSTTSYADRDYFKIQLNREMRGKLFVGQPAIGRVNKEEFFFISRRVESTKGEFLGVVVAPLKVKRYVSMFEDSRFGPDISVALIHGAGKVIARIPDFKQTFAREAPADLFEHARTARTGTYQTQDNLFSYRVFEHFPLLIVVGSNDVESTKSLRKNYLIAGAGLLLLLLLIWGGGHFSLRTYVKQHERELRYRALYIASSEMEKELLAGEEQMKLATLLFQNSGEGMMVSDAEGRILTINPAFSLLSGYTEQELIGHFGYELTSGRQDMQFFDRMREAIDQTGQWEGELWHRHKDGTEYLVAMRFNAVYDEFGNTYRRVVLFSDITEKKASEELIWRQANFDALTGLPNRRMFYEHLRQEMKKTERSQLPMALVFVDLDHFKEINDTMGHDKGDILLKQVAMRLSGAVRGSDIVARLGGDEFIVIISELSNSSDVLRIAQEILSQMSQPFLLSEEHDGNTAHISSSIGITLYPQDGNDAETLIKNADQAMYAAKQQGRNRYEYFSSALARAKNSSKTVPPVYN